MLKYIVITLDGKKYRFPIDDVLDKALKEELINDYEFDDNSNLIRKKEETITSYKLNFKILKALTTLLKKAELPAEYQDRIEKYDTKKPDAFPNAVSLSFLEHEISELIILYSEFCQLKEDTTSSLNTEQTRNEYQVPILNEALKILLNGINNKIIPFTITEDQIKEAINKVHICKDNDEFKKLYIKYGELTKEEINLCLYQTAAFYVKETGEIIFPPTISLDTLIHELCHSLSYFNNECSIKIIARELQKEDKNWENITELHINILNEALTDFITGLLLTKNIHSAYSNGSKFFQKYAYDEINLNEILDAYFAQNKEALASIATKINSVKENLWFEILDSALIYQAVNLLLIPIKNIDKCKKEEEMDAIIEDLKAKRKLK